MLLLLLYFINARCTHTHNVKHGIYHYHILWAIMSNMHITYLCSFCLMLHIYLLMRLLKDFWLLVIYLLIHLTQVGWVFCIGGSKGKRLGFPCYLFYQRWLIFSKQFNLYLTSFTRESIGHPLVQNFKTVLYLIK